MMAIIRKWIAASVCTVALVGLCLPASAEEGTGLRRIEGEPVYESFTYIDDGENGIVDIVSPAAYRPVYIADAASMGTTLSEPVDLFVQGDKVYIVDRAGGKVIITDRECRIEQEITGFEWKGQKETFLNPEGVYVSGEKIYVADTGHRRIVVLGADGGCESVITEPESEMLTEDLNS